VEDVTPGSRGGPGKQAARETSRVFAVVGQGYGDEGKGACVHWLAYRCRAHTVVRTGGPQAFHRVVTASGAEQVFSQFGSATLRGVRTHLSRNMVIDPDAILNEGQALQYEQGIRNVFDYLSIHEGAPVITPYHGIANRVRELARGPDRHGTVGMGVGETLTDAVTPGVPAIRAADLTGRQLEEKLEAIRERKLGQLREVVESSPHLTGAAAEQVRREMQALADPETVKWALERFRLMAARVRIVDTTFLAEEILGRGGTVVFEGSQGVLLDPECGSPPFTTQVRTTPVATTSLLEECGFGGELIVLGAIRAYHTRHGAGPFVSECPDLTRLLPDPYNGDHPWQGHFRVGPLDVVALRHAVELSGGSRVLRGLVVSCVDRIHRLGSWRYCDSYTTAAGKTIERLAGLLASDRKAAAGLLQRCRPVFQKQQVDPKVDAATFGKTLAAMVQEKTGIPVAAISLGETELDKIESGAIRFQ
jgi:adenylosuccinate synthase